MTLGHHTLIELNDCDAVVLADVAGLRKLLLEAVQAAGGTYVNDVFHHFSPHGVSGVVVVAESHVTIHTWPEHRYAAADVFTCGVTFRHEVLVGTLQTGLKAEKVETRTIERGFLKA